MFVFVFVVTVYFCLRKWRFFYHFKLKCFVSVKSLDSFTIKKNNTKVMAKREKKGHRDQ